MVTVRHGDHSGLADVRKRLDTSPATLKLGPYAVMHAIADHVVDHYLDVTDMIEVDIDAMEAEVFSPRTTPTSRASTCSSARSSSCGGRSAR